MHSKTIPVVLLLTACSACAKPVSSYYPSRLNGLAVTAQESASDANKCVSQIEVNNREMSKVNDELRAEAEIAEKTGRSLSGKR